MAGRLVDGLSQCFSNLSGHQKLHVGLCAHRWVGPTSDRLGLPRTYLSSKFPNADAASAPLQRPTGASWWHPDPSKLPPSPHAK